MVLRVSPPPSSPPLPRLPKEWIGGCGSGSELILATDKDGAERGGLAEMKRKTSSPDLHVAWGRWGGGGVGGGSLAALMLAVTFHR